MTLRLHTLRLGYRRPSFMCEKSLRSRLAHLRMMGTPVEGAARLSPGECAGFRSGTGNAHHLVNETDRDVVYLEIGDRTPGDSAVWPDDDLQIIEVDGKMRMGHRDGTPY